MDFSLEKNPMIKAVCFDGDGVCFDSRLVHFYALNSALEEHGYTAIPYSRFEFFDGLGTMTKLSMLAAEGLVLVKDFEKIEKSKQNNTIIEYKKFKPNDKLISALIFLKEKGYRVALVTNAVFDTTEVVLKQMNISQYFDVIVTTSDLPKGRGKPHGDIYKLALDKLRVKPEESLAFEDNERGLKAVRAAGIPEKNITKVLDPFDIGINYVLKSIQKAS